LDDQNIIIVLVDNNDDDDDQDTDDVSDGNLDDNNDDKNTVHDDCNDDGDFDCDDCCNDNDDDCDNNDDDDDCDDNDDDDDCDDNDDDDGGKIIETFYNWSFHMVTKCLFNQSRCSKEVFGEGESILNTVNWIKVGRYDDCNDVTKQETFEELEMLKKSDSKYIKQEILMNWTTNSYINGL